MGNNLELLSTQLAEITEAGVERQLNQSILFSPFRLFFRLFKKSNPQLMQQIRNMLANDIAKILTDLEKWDETIFIKSGGHLTSEGNLLVKRCYNVGIRLVKKINVRMAFKAMRDRGLQQELYDYVLDQIRGRTDIILKNF